MKKRILLLSMVGGLTLVGCSGISQITDDQGNQVIVTLGDGTTYTANDLFDNYSSSETGASQYFEAVYDVLVRAVQPITNTIEQTVSNNLDDFVQSARSAASTNGTSYSQELSDALEEQGVESLDELEEIYILDAQKEEFEQDYYDANEKQNLYSLLKEYIEYYAPYHIRHILVESSAGTSLNRGTLSEQDARDLSSAVRLLAEGNLSFGEIALQVSDDSSSASKYGETSIMDTTTTFVNEFKYAVYQYDALYNANATDAVTAYNERQTGESSQYVMKSGSPLIPLSEEDTTYLEESINRIPYQAFVNLGNMANITTNENGMNVMDGNESYYPRNILFNLYLNDHALNVITRGTEESVQDSDRFVHVDGLSASENTADDILCDENHNPILVARGGSGDSSSSDSETSSGYQGMFFIVIQKSPFEKTADQTVDQLIDSMMEYYTMETPTATDDVSQMDNYVTFIKGTESDYATRANDIEELVKGFDSHMSFRFYEKALADAQESKGGVTINENISELIDAYISAARDTASYDAQETYQNSWDEYVRLLKLQDQLESTLISEDQIKQFDSDYQTIGGNN